MRPIVDADSAELVLDQLVVLPTVIDLLGVSALADIVDHTVDCLVLSQPGLALCLLHIHRLVVVTVVAAVLDKAAEGIFCRFGIVDRGHRHRCGDRLPGLVDQLHVVRVVQPLGESRCQTALLADLEEGVPVVAVLGSRDGLVVALLVDVGLLLVMHDPVVEGSHIRAGSDRVEGDHDVDPVLCQRPIDHLVIGGHKDRADVLMIAQGFDLVPVRALILVHQHGALSAGVRSPSAEDGDVDVHAGLPEDPCEVGLLRVGQTAQPLQGCISDLLHILHDEGRGVLGERVEPQAVLAVEFCDGLCGHLEDVAVVGPVLLHLLGPACALRILCGVVDLISQGDSLLCQLRSIGPAHAVGKHASALSGRQILGGNQLRAAVCDVDPLCKPCPHRAGVRSGSEKLLVQRNRRKPFLSRILCGLIFFARIRVAGLLRDLVTLGL